VARVVWSEPALEDLEEIAEYIAADSPRYAQITITRIFERTEVLETHPSIGRMVPELEDESTRELIEGNYRIVYVLKDHGIVYILRVLHGARLFKVDP
jgi:addiction module RelE/StbE family toxin